MLRFVSDDGRISKKELEEVLSSQEANTNGWDEVQIQVDPGNAKTQAVIRRKQGSKAKCCDVLL